MQRAKTGAQKVLSIFDNPQGFDVVYECTGALPAIQQSIYVSILSPHPGSLSPSDTGISSQNLLHEN